MNSRPVLLLLVVLTLFIVPTALGAQNRGIAATIVASAPVTLLPEEGRAPLATLPEGSQVQVLGPAEDGWYRISFQDSYLWGDRIGYVRMTNVKVSAPIRVTPPTVFDAPSPSTPKPAPVRSPNGLSDSGIAAAISAGYRQKDLPQGLRLLDTGERWTDRPTVNGAESNPATVRLQIYTPLAWIQQLASDAARRGRAFNVENVTEEMTEPVLRVTVTSANAGAPRARHLVLRAGTRDLVVQPLSKEAFSEHVLNAESRSAVFDGLRLTFPLDAVRNLRGPTGDGEFFITVIDAGGVAKDIRISRAQLHDLPM